jgi:hypothetical protein
MTSDNKLSRLAGLLYLISVVTGMFSLVYVPSQINVANDLQATLGNIVASESLFRLGIASSMVDQTVFLLLPLVLFRLLRHVDRNAAVLMVALAAVGAALTLANLTHRLDALSLLTDTRFGQVFTPGQLQATARLSLDAYGNGLLVAHLFWGLWLLPFGYLVLKSGFLPRVLGILLMLGCLGYLVDVFGELLVPHYSDSIVPDYIGLPAAVAEIGTCLWLLLVGARPVRKSPQPMTRTGGRT